MVGFVRPVLLTGANQAVLANYGMYAGFTVRETSGSATALVRIWDNASAGSGIILEEISLLGGESARELYARAIRADNGIYVTVSGAVAGSVRVG